MAQALPLFDVVIIGAGPAGLAAGLFTARCKLRTLLLDRGTSALRQCAYLDNYLGFPGGVDVTEFLERGRRQAVQAGCVIRNMSVTAIARAPDGQNLIVTLRDRSSVHASRCIYASGWDVRALRALSGELFDDDGELRVPALDEHGRSPVPGLYIAGTLAGVESQALIAAGHAARVALAVVRDARMSTWSWEPLAGHLDWQPRQGLYASERWAERVRAHFRAKIAVSDDDRAHFDELLERWIADKRAQQLDRGEIVRQHLRAHARAQVKATRAGAR